MKLIELRQDIVLESDVPTIIKEVKSKCGPWLSRYGLSDVRLYRGTTALDKDMFLKPVRQDRKPLNSKLNEHQISIKFLNVVAENRGVKPGVANRQNSAFCYANTEVNRKRAGDYGSGKGFLYFPVGEFRTTYIEGVGDLFVAMPVTQDDEKLFSYLMENFADKVVFDDLSGDIGSSEVMVHSMEGLYVNGDYVPELLDSGELG